MRGVTVFIVVCALGQAACAEKNAPGDAVAQGAKKTNTVLAKEAAPSEKTGESAKPPNLLGEVRILGEREPTEAGKISLEFGEGGTVRGTMALEKRRLAFQGTVEGETIRAWVVDAESRKEGGLRGHLTGTRSPQSAEGTFAFSENAGKPNWQGSWKAE